MSDNLLSKRISILLFSPDIKDISITITSCDERSLQAQTQLELYAYNERRELSFSDTPFKKR